MAEGRGGGGGGAGGGQAHPPKQILLEDYNVNVLTQAMHFIGPLHANLCSSFIN